MLSFTIGRESISVLLDGEFNTIDASHANFPLLLAELKKPVSDRDIDSIRTFVKIKAMLEHLSIGRVSVFEDEIQFDGTAVHNYMTERMLEILADGIDLEPWVRFMDNVFCNPAGYAIDELYQWLEKAKMPLTPDGCFLAFKKVRADYTDCHTGRFDNSPGTILEMDRELCDPNRDNHCSTGFHFCSIGYLGHFGGQKVVIVKIDPKHVTSIPSDYKFTKGRCHRYEVVGELSGQSAAAHKVWRKSVLNLVDPSEYPADVLKNVKFAEDWMVEQAESDPADDAVQTRAMWEQWDREGCANAVAQKIITQEQADAYLAECKVRYDTLFDRDGNQIRYTPESRHALYDEACRLTEEDMTDAGKADDYPTKAACFAKVPFIQADLSQTAETGKIGIKTTMVDPADHGVAPKTEPWATVVDPEEDLRRMAASLRAQLHEDGDSEPFFTTTDDRAFPHKLVKTIVAAADSNRQAARVLDIGESTLRGWIKKL